ncbi:MAG: hypothetical protein IMZ61_00215 [Planctomycetes bacterium]|nr:hypothetical protein [Planctomycetota bacterium]
MTRTAKMVTLCIIQWLGRKSLAQLRITFCTYVTSPEANKDEGLCGEAARRSAA